MNQFHLLETSLTFEGHSELLQLLLSDLRFFPLPVRFHAHILRIRQNKFPQFNLEALDRETLHQSFADFGDQLFYQMRPTGPDDLVDFEDHAGIIDGFRQLIV